MADADCHTAVRLRMDNGRVNSREPRGFGGGYTPRGAGCPPVCLPVWFRSGHARPEQGRFPQEA
jgi:hypothetical protein